MAKFLDDNGLLYLWSKIKAIVPTKTSQITNDSGYITSSDIPEGAAASTTTPKMNGTAAVGTEMAFARGDHVHPSDTTKVDKVSGKGLSTNDFTNELLTKLTNIEAGANKYSHPTYTAKTSGFYKVTVDATGHVSSVTAVTKGDITGLGIPAQDTVYTHPEYDEQASGFYKITVDDTGHVSEVVAVTKADITALGIPAQDTTYNDATTSTHGLMSVADKKKLDGIDENANAYSLPNATSSVLGGVKIGTNISVSSGVISVANGSTSAKGVVQLTDGVASTSTTTAATPKAVKTAYDLANSKQSPATSLSGYGITDAYTKTEIDAKLTSAVKYKGTKTNYSDLPTSGNVTGDMWNITNASSANGVKAGDNVVWNGTAWDVQSGAVDLSGCVQNADAITNAEIDTIVAS